MLRYNIMDEKKKKKNELHDNAFVGDDGWCRLTEREDRLEKFVLWI